MLLTISTTYRPATDLGYLLHKHPGQLQTFPLSFGTAHVFYPEATEEKCTAALLLEIDPIDLVRRHKGAPDRAVLEQYVNDRPYVASSFLSVAIAEIFGTALSGRSKEREELVNTRIPLEANLPCLPCRGGERFLRSLFEPLGYEVECTAHQLDEQFPEWGRSSYFTVKLCNRTCLRDLLSHLYVLMPVLDDNKHYWIGTEEVDKLLRHAKTWLPTHPAKDQITSRYLRHRHSLTRLALQRLSEEDAPDPDEQAEKHTAEEAALEESISLNEQRLGQVLAVLKKAQVHRVADLGCGEGKLLKALLDQREFEDILGMDVSCRALNIAEKRLHLSDLPDKLRNKIKLIQGSLTYKDKRLSGYEAATCIEVIEHLDETRLTAFERVVFEFARPSLIVVTTPNVEYNCKFQGLAAGKFRHKDHRFEWTRSEFQAWAMQIASKNGYSVAFLPVGPEDESAGSPTQMGVFKR